MTNVATGIAPAWDCPPLLPLAGLDPEN